MLIFNPLFIAIVAHFFVLFFYKNISIPPLHFALLLLVFLFSNFYFLSYLKKFRISGVSFLQGLHWRFYSLIVVGSSIIEYTYFGLPILGDTLYTEYGFPFLHHIVVSSWLVVFIKFRSKKISYLMLIFAILNPIFILNRDLLMLTLFIIMARFWLSGYINKKRFLLAIPLILILFSVLGDIRSPNALNAVDLPFSFDLTASYLVWPIIYFTAATFNMLNNFNSLSYDLYSPLITTFPEYYKFIVQFGIFGIIVYVFLAMLPIFYSNIFINREQRVFMLFVYYQLIAGILFSSKLFNTHLLFTLLLFSLMSYTSSRRWVWKRAVILPKINTQ
jgi:hypothetical protein